MMSSSVFLVFIYLLNHSSFGATHRCWLMLMQNPDEFSVLKWTRVPLNVIGDNRVALVDMKLVSMFHRKIACCMGQTLEI